MDSLQNSPFRFLPLVVFGAALASAQSTTASLPLLTHADQVRHLSAEEAALGYPVRIRGVITDDVRVPWIVRLLLTFPEVAFKTIRAGISRSTS